jgi:hypothetical protein
VAAREHVDAIGVRVVADAGVTPEFRDYNAFSWDLNLLYELEVVALTDPERVSGGTPSWILARGGRTIPADLRLRVSESRFGSPFEIALVAAALPTAASALWLLVRSIEKLSDIPGSRRLQAAQEKLALAQTRLTDAQAEAQEQKNERRLAEASALARPVEGGRSNPVQTVEKRLQESRIRIVDVEVTTPWDD